MNSYKQTTVTAFALFSMFFGAGNAILPPLLGYENNTLWPWLLVGFSLSAVLIPLLGILAHAKLQNGTLHFGDRVSPAFSLAFCVCLYVIAVVLPGARTAAVTHEMAVAPYVTIPSWVTSLVYFSLVYILVIRRQSLLDVIGKYLTPLLLVALLTITMANLFQLPLPPVASTPHASLMGEALIEGYQTFDAIASIVVGGVLVVSLQLQEKTSYRSMKTLIRKSGILAGMGLFVIYGLLMANGAGMTERISSSGISRTLLLQQMGTQALGTSGSYLLSLLIALACFTTAVGVITGTTDFFSEWMKAQNRGYRWIALIACLTGWIMGQFAVADIILYAYPVLLLVYPACISLILLHLIPEKYSSPRLYRYVIAVTLLFSIPDALAATNITLGESLRNAIPWGDYNLGWVLPSVLTGIVVISGQKRKAS